MAESTNTPRLPLELRKRVHALSASYNKWLHGGLAALFVLPFLLVLIIAWGEPDFWESVREKIVSDPRFWIILVGVPLVAGFFWFTIRHERLILTSSGIEYRSPFRGPLGFLRALKPDWRLGWGEIDSAELRKGARLPRKNVHNRKLYLHVRHGETRTLQPYAWYALPDEAGLGIPGLSRLDDERFMAAVRASPLYRVMAERGLLEEAREMQKDARGAKPDLPLARYPGGGFDLGSHPGTIALLAGLTLLGGYAVADTFFVSPWRYAEWPPAGPFLAAAIGAAVVAYLVTGAAPTLERWALTALFAAAAAGAVYPALLRVNAATDADGASAYRYRQVAAGHFQPVDIQHMPDLHFSHGWEFWQSLPDGGEREFRLARGALEFWQLDHSEVIEAQQVFYMRHGGGG